MESTLSEGTSGSNPPATLNSSDVSVATIDEIASRVLQSAFSLGSNLIGQSAFRLLLCGIKFKLPEARAQLLQLYHDCTVACTCAMRAPYEYDRWFAARS